GLAVAGGAWPNAWPPPEASELMVDLGVSRLVLPQVVGASPVQQGPRFALVEHAPSASGDSDAATWRIEHDVYGREKRVVVRQRSTSAPSETCRVRRTDEVRTGVSLATPGRAWVESVSESEVTWPEVTARTNARL